MIDLSKMTKAEFDLYLSLLSHAYAIEKEITGCVCASEAEECRDKMYQAALGAAEDFFDIPRF